VCLAAAVRERSRRMRHISFVAHGEGTGVVARMLLDEARRLRPGAGAEGDVRSPFYRTRHVAIVRPGRSGALALAGSGNVPSLSPETAALVAELAAEARRFADATLPAPVLHHVAIDPANPHTIALAARALASLPVAYREALLLVAVEGLRHSDAAEICGVTPETMRQRVCRARALLARRLTDAEVPVLASLKEITT